MSTNIVGFQGEKKEQIPEYSSYEELWISSPNTGPWKVKICFRYMRTYLLVMPKDKCASRL